MPAVVERARQLLLPGRIERLLGVEFFEHALCLPVRGVRFGMSADGAEGLAAHVVAIRGLLAISRVARKLRVQAFE